ncbi:MAG: type II secretion system F family protein [bacterium]
MNTFEYRGLDLQGRTRKGLVEALDPKDARDKLSKNGVLVERIAPAGDRQPRLRLFHSRGLSLDHRTVIYRELGALLRAGLSVIKALDILIDSPELGEARSILAHVRDHIREGQSLADAMSRASESVSLLEKALIAVGERSGTLGDALDSLASFVEEQQSVKDRVRTALVYPAVVLIIALAVATGVFTFVLPQTEKLLTEMHIAMPAITRIMMGTGKVFAVCGIPLAVILSFIGLRIRSRMRNEAALRMDVGRYIFSIPLIGRGVTIMVNLRFSRTLAILMHGGVPLVEGLQLAGRATGNAWVESLAESASESVRHGGSLADAVRKIPPLSETLPGWIQAGEAGGNLEGLLHNAGERYQRQWLRFITRSLGLLEPVIILLLGIFVLLVALSVLMPIISANQLMK